MAHLIEVPVTTLDATRLRPHLLSERWEQLLAACRRQAGHRRTMWHVNSTAAGGGVAEMLRPLIGYGRDLGITMGWLVLEADLDFFTITKRVDNGLSGVAGDGGPLGAAEHRLYRRTCATAATGLDRFVRPGDIVVLHDPQTAGLVEHVAALGALPIWRLHNGADDPNTHTAAGWDFLRPYLAAAAAFVVSMPHFGPDWLRDKPTATITPFLDPLAAKNREMPPAAVAAQLGRWGLLETATAAPDPGLAPAVLRAGGATPEQRDTVVQVSRWDDVKDMAGVLRAFAEVVAPATDADLLLVGPEVTGVADDPEAGAYYDRCVRQWRALPPGIRDRTHLVCLPMADPEAHATVINALQRHATVVTQKSRSEGFGLTVTEAMWKGTPVLGTAVGGLRLQIDSPEVGVLVPPAASPSLFGAALVALLNDADHRAALGHAARERVRRDFLPDTALLAELDLIAGLGLEAAVCE
ncbi:glycosyltransferase [Nocardia sp. NPDC048505]|uniref:glycosyltransferase n=1 Tax=unclassified Nocardia TaxID=2637762 RepID=UPI0033E9F4FB